MQEIAQQAGQLLIVGCFLGLGLSLPLVLVVEGLTALFHTFLRIIGKGG